MSAINNLNIITNSIGYTVDARSGYCLVARPDCLTGRQCDTLKDVPECLASMIKDLHNKFVEETIQLLDAQNELAISNHEKFHKIFQTNNPNINQ